MILQYVYRIFMLLHKCSLLLYDGGFNLYFKIIVKLTKRSGNMCNNSLISRDTIFLKWTKRTTSKWDRNTILFWCNHRYSRTTPVVSVILWFLFLTNTSDCLHVYTPLIPPLQNASLLKIVNDTVCVSTAPVMSVILTMICKWSLLHIYTYYITKFDCKLFPHLISCTVYTNNNLWDLNFVSSTFYFIIVQHLFAFPTGCWKKNI